ncbi:MAG: translocation/assembly module TamB domain-containing protein [Chromatiales bacterium]|nr:translocation/assembly module TamB domain-containing protein [Chromatiales bacterium]
MPRAGRWLTRTVLALLLVAALLVAALLGAATTESGSRWLVSRLFDRAPIDAQFQGFRGRIDQRFGFDQLRLRIDDTRVEIARIDVHWRPALLFAGMLDVVEIDAEGVSVALPASEPAGIELPEFAPAWSARIGRARIAALQWHDGTDVYAADRIDLSARMDAKALHLSRLKTASGALTVQGHATVGFVTGFPLDAEISWRFEPANGEPFAGRGKLGGTLARIELDQTLLAPVTLGLTGGVYPLAARTRFDLDAQWADLSWPPEGAALVTSGGGQLKLAGTTDQYVLETEASFAGTGIPPGNLKVRGSGDRSQLTIDDLHATLLDGRVTGSGQVRFSDVPFLTMALESAGLDPSNFWPVAAGRADARIKLTVDPAAASVVRAEVEQISGTLGGFPLSGRGTVAVGNQTQFRDFEVSLGENRLNAHGSLGERNALEFTLDAPALQRLGADFGGSLKAAIKLAGTSAAPAISATGTARNLRWTGWRIGTAALDAALDLAPNARSRIGLKATEITSAAIGLDGVDLTADGTRESHTLTLAARADALEVSLSAAGALTDERWNGRLETLRLNEPGTGTWELAEPAKVFLGTGRAGLERMCIRRGQASVCAQAKHGPDGAQASAEFRAIPAAFAAPWLPAGVRASGVVDGELRWSGAPAATALLELRSESIGIASADPGAAIPPLQLSALRSSARFADDRLHATLTAALPDDGKLDAELSTDATDASGHRRLSGQASARIDSIAMFQPLIGQLDGLGGRLRANLAVSGTTVAPRVTGEARLEDGHARLVGAGIELAGAELTARGDADAIAIAGRARSGTGVIRLDGKLMLDADSGFPLRLAIEGKDFRALDWPEAQVDVSPTVNLAHDGRELSLTGRVDVPHAAIRLKELPRGAVQVSPDEVIIGPAAQKTPVAPDRALPIRAQLVVALGEDVRFDGLGLGARLGGQVALTQNPGQSPRGNGRLVVLDGRYKAYGQDLRLARGEFVFAGPLDDPGLDLRAERTSGDVTAAVELGGTVSQPKAVLSSTPAMPDEQVLAYLVTGKPLAAAGTTDADALASAALSLGADRAQPLLQRIGAALGVDEFRIDADAGLAEAGLEIGKYLQPEFYVGYAATLADPSGALLVKYRLTDRLRLKARAGKAQAVGIEFELERN